MVVSDDIYVMLLTNAKFKDFSPKEICDATKSTEVLLVLSCESRSIVDEIVGKAIAAGVAPIAIRRTMGSWTPMDFKTWMALWEVFHMESMPPPSAA